MDKIVYAPVLAHYKYNDLLQPHYDALARYLERNCGLLPHTLKSGNIVFYSNGDTIYLEYTVPNEIHIGIYALPQRILDWLSSANTFEITPIDEYIAWLKSLYEYDTNN